VVSHCKDCAICGLRNWNGESNSREKDNINDGFEAVIIFDVGFLDDQYLPVGKADFMLEAIQSKHGSLGTPNFSMGLNDHRKKQESVSDIPITKLSVK